MYAMSIVDRSSFPVLAGPEIHPPVKLARPACLSPDGAWLAGAGEDRAVRVWETASGQETALLPQGSPITTLAAADGPAALAIATQNGALIFCPSIAGPPVALARALTGPITELSFSADGSRLLARGESGVEIWRTSAPAETSEAFSLETPVSGASLSADGRRVFAWNAREAAVWDAATPRQLLRVTAGQRFHGGALAAGGGRMALLDGSFSARVWDVATGQLFRPVEISLTSPTQLALDAAGERLTLAGNSNRLTVIDVASGLRVSPPMRHHYTVTDLQPSPDGARAMSYGRDDTVRLWDARTGQAAMLGIPLGGIFGRSPGLALSRDGSMALVHTAAQERSAESVTVWRATRKNDPWRRTYEGQRDFDAARLSPDGRLGAVGLCPVNRALVFDLETNKTLLDAGVQGPAYAHLFSADSRRYFVLTANGWIHGWSLETGRELWQPNHQPGSVRAAALSPDGARIVAGSTDGHIRIYDTATGEVVQTLDHPGEIKTLRFAPDRSGRFVTGSTDRVAHIWDLHGGRLLQTFTGHTDTIISAVWSPDSRRIATASFDQTARVWDAATGRPVGAIMPHASSLAQVTFDPGGGLLATACRDGSARLWHASTGQPASSPLLQGAACETVRFTADGAALLVRDHDGFRFWDAATAEPVTVRYLEPESDGLGMDSENYRAIMSDNGRRVFLGHSMDETALWSIAQPRGRAPAWLPEFLEMLVQCRLDARGEIHAIDRREAAAALAAGIRRAAANDEFSAWAGRILGPPE
jgi:WD40 repeat protein